MKFHCLRAAAVAALSAGLVLLARQSAAAPKAGSPGAEHARIVAYWTKERVAAAIPRDLRIDGAATVTSVTRTARSNRTAT
jgi:hypothetical protein